MASIKKAQKGLPIKKKPVVDSVESEMFPGRKIPRSQSNYATGDFARMLEGNKPKKASSSSKRNILPKAKPGPSKLGKKDILPKAKPGAPKKVSLKKGGKLSTAKDGKEMIKRADGSYSQRGLWDNIRANKGSGKKPTAQMLKQEKKIKAQSKKKK